MWRWAYPRTQIICFCLLQHQLPYVFRHAWTEILDKSFFFLSVFGSSLFVFKSLIIIFKHIVLSLDIFTYLHTRHRTKLGGQDSLNTWNYFGAEIIVTTVFTPGNFPLFFADFWAFVKNMFFYFTTFPFLWPWQAFKDGGQPVCEYGVIYCLDW